MICAAAYTGSWKYSDPSIYLVIMLKSETKHGQTAKQKSTLRRAYIQYSCSFLFNNSTTSAKAYYIYVSNSFLKGRDLQPSTSKEPLCPVSSQIHLG